MRRIGLVGCVKAKQLVAAPAKDLYVSALFAGRRRMVQATCSEWSILSALHGLVSPGDVLEPYDLALKSMSRSQRRGWSEAALADVDRRIRPVAGDTFELHAGAEYRDFGLIEGLRDRGCLIDNPTVGMGIGRQLQFYAQR